MDELVKAVNDVTIMTNASLLDKSIDVILTSLDNEGGVRDECVQLILESRLTSSLKSHLASGSCNRETAARLVAELAKTEEARLQCTAVGLIAPLIDILSSGNVSETIQACRALGNICFDNDNGRCEVCEQNGVDRLLELLSVQLGLEPESPSMLRKVACGFLFNLINTHGRAKLSGGTVQEPYGRYKFEPTSPTSLESMRMITLRIKLTANLVQESLIEKALSLGIVNILGDYLVKFGTDEDVVMMTLLATGALADSEIGRSKVAECKMVSTITGLLESAGVSVELQETVLELLATLAESDEIKVELADNIQFDRLLNVLKRTREAGDDQLALTNLVADLIVLLLTGDDSMKLLYDGGKGRVLSEALEWMKSSSIHLQNSGALIFGNIARSDTHCVQLVEAGVTSDLLALLERHPVDDGNSITHHAVFSALRNLAIPAANKPAMLRQQLLDKVLPYSESPMSTVLFKLLGTLRMVVDGQEAASISLGTNDAFMDKLSGWCKVEDHEGVRGEANRLVASLIKNARSRAVMESVARCGALQFLVKMSSAEHVVMQNEAIIALTLTATVMGDAVAGSLADLNLVQQLKEVVTNNETVVELLHNCLALVKSLASSEVLRQQLISAGFPAVIAELRKHDNAGLKNLASGITLVN